MLVPKGKLRLALLKECHDGPVAGHRGLKSTLAELVKNYSYPNLWDDVEQYVKSCVTCQQNRTQFRKEAGLLRPLPIPTKCWESVLMDFMTHLLESKGFDSIMVVVDRVSKMAHFVPTRDIATTQEVGRLYFDKVVKHYGMHKSIISDRDPKFYESFLVCALEEIGHGAQNEHNLFTSNRWANGTSELGFVGVFAKLHECGPNGLGRSH